MREDTVPEGQYDFEPLSREIVVNRLRDADDPCRAAAKTARDIILPALKATLPAQEPRITAYQVCRGVTTGILAISKDVPETALAILEMTAEIAAEGSLEPADLMTWAMEGIASVMYLAGPEIRSAVHSAIEGRFMGAGAIFSDLCRKHAH
ncbi:MAG: hypothetical protein HY748_10000 [Elusimicrobia bacterium]|nr:hypothetical protein [Elusimicrobiota bacterium]